HEINPQIPEGFEDVAAQSLAKDPSKRYQRGREMAAALRAVVRGERPSKPHEPLLEEATVITRSHEKIPTIEIPFPEASAIIEQAPHANPHSTVSAGAAAPAASALVLPPPARPTAPPQN